MSVARKKMQEALLEWVVPVLRSRGFNGVFPHYYRINEKHADLLMFQLTYFDDAFCVNLAQCPTRGIELKDGTIIPPEEVKAFYCRHKLILGADSLGSYHWFKYNPRPVELRERDKYPFLTMYPDGLLKYKQIADDIIGLINTQGEEWWGEASQIEEEIDVMNSFFLETQKLMGN